MEKAKVNEFSKMTLEEAKKLPNDGKLVDGKFMSLTLKRGIVKDNEKEYIERRVFKNADMVEPIVYDLPLPLNMTQAKEMYGESDCLDAIWTAKRIKTDAVKAGKGQGDPEVQAQKASEKLVTSLRKLGQNKAADEVEALLKKQAEIRKGMKSHGFGK